MTTNDQTEITTRLSFGEAVERLSREIARAGMTIFARIDHAAAARDVGLTMLPTLVFIYGNAKGGTPIMQSTPAAALDLPLRVLIREDADGYANISFHPVRKMLIGVGVPEALATGIEPAQHLIREAFRSE